jgi:prolyl-tRNA editing enzyme YbaK/EbsC (Cys-tRNA(Pro) deacylase)
VPFAVHEFRHQHGATDYGDEAACALGVGKLSPESLAAALGAKRAEMMLVADAARITGTA